MIIIVLIIPTLLLSCNVKPTLKITHELTRCNASMAQLWMNHNLMA